MAKSYLSKDLACEVLLILAYPALLLSYQLSKKITPVYSFTTITSIVGERE